MRLALFLLSALAFGQTMIMRPMGVLAPQQAASFASPGANGIDYHGGPVMTQPSVAYNIFYGDWSTPTLVAARAIIERAQFDLSDSPYFRINESYYQQDGRHVSATISTVISIADGYSRGRNLAGWSDIGAIVRNAINASQFPADTNGLYSVFTSPDVTLPGFLSVFCGRHGGFSLNGVNIKYQFTGAIPQSTSGCSVQPIGPNGFGPADAIINVMSHEFDEMLTDPLVENGTPAWYFDESGDENADHCGWTFDPTYTAPNGATANVKINGHDYLIQKNWSNSNGGSCKLVADGLPAPGPAVITLTSTPPVNDICESFDPLKTYTLSASAIDTADGDISSLLRWTDFGVLIGQGGSIQYSVPCSSSLHRIVVSVTNTRQYASSVTFEFTRTLSPVLIIISPLRGQVFTCPVTIQFAASATDPTGDVSDRIQWFAPGTGQFGSGRVAGKTFDCTQLGDPGLWATVTDTFGSTAQSVIDFTIAGITPPPPPPPVNTAPSVHITTPGNGSTFSCGTVRLTALGIDPEDGNISNRIRWSWFGGSATGSSISISYGCGGPNLGLKTVTASLTDSGGLSAVPSTVSYTIKKK